VVVKPYLVLIVGRPGDDLAPCPFCGEPIAFNPAIEAVSHQLPACASFAPEVSKTANYAAAVEMLKARTVTA